MSKYEAISETTELNSDGSSPRPLKTGRRSMHPNPNFFAAPWRCLVYIFTTAFADNVNIRVTRYILVLVIYAITAIFFTAYSILAPALCDGENFVEQDKVMDQFSNDACGGDYVDKIQSGCMGLRVIVIPWLKNVEVDALWSGLSLAVLLTGAALSIRGLYRELSGLHPFRMAARTHVSLTDMDSIMDPGISSMKQVRRHSNWTAFLQTSLIIAGTALVPIGSLSITTGYYSPRTHGSSDAGLPTAAGRGQSLATQLGKVPWQSGSSPSRLRIRDPDPQDDGYSGVGSSGPSSDTTTPPASGGRKSTNNLSYKDFDCFASNAAGLATSILVVQNGELTKTRPLLGPASTRYLTYNTGVQYKNLVTFEWQAGCEDASKDIKFVPSGDGKSATFFFPDGSSEASVEQSSIAEPLVYMSYKSTQYAGAAYDQRANANLDLLPYGGTVYFATSGSISQTDGKLGPGTQGVSTNAGHWTSLVKCTPKLTWGLSTCTYDGSAMSDCTSTPKPGKIPLSTEGLDKISNYMTSTAWFMYVQKQLDSDTSGIGTWSVPFLSHPDKGKFKVPTVDDYTNFFGIIASSIVTATTSGWYGTAKVETVGQPVKQVYIARLYIVIPIMVLLVVVPLMAIADIVYTLRHRLPFRKASFLTIASAVRGEWWESEMDGLGGMSQDEIRKSSLGKKVWITFGEDPADPKKIGFAPQVDLR